MASRALADFLSNMTFGHGGPIKPFAATLVVAGDRIASKNFRVLVGIFPTVNEFFRPLPNFSDSYRIFPTATDFFRRNTTVFSRHIPTFLSPNRCALFRYIPSPFPDLHPPIPSPHAPNPPSHLARPTPSSAASRRRPPARNNRILPTKSPNFADRNTEFYRQTPQLSDRTTEFYRQTPHLSDRTTEFCRQTPKLSNITGQRAHLFTVSTSQG